MYIEEARHQYRNVLYPFVVQTTPALLATDFDTKGLIAPKHWECLAAILRGDRKSRSRYGIDLCHAEVKTALDMNGKFDYQWHRKNWRKTFWQQMQNDHVFVTFPEDYSWIVVRVLTPEYMQPRLLEWRPRIYQAYVIPEKPEKRCRATLDLGYVKKYGTVIFEDRIEAPVASPKAIQLWAS